MRSPNLVQPEEEAAEGEGTLPWAPEGQQHLHLVPAAPSQDSPLLPGGPGVSAEGLLSAWPAL